MDVSVQEAAQHYGVAPATIRRWIKNGKLVAHQHHMPQGFEWRVQLPDHDVQLVNHGVQLPDHASFTQPARADALGATDDQLVVHH